MSQRRTVDNDEKRLSPMKTTPRSSKLNCETTTIALCALRWRKITAFSLAVSLSLIACTPLLFAGSTTKTYAGSYKGQECSVQVNWHNWSGLGAVDGHINLPGDTTIPFSGNNSRAGVLEIEAQGEGLTLTKERDGGTVTWVSADLAFTESGAGVDAPAKRKSSAARGTAREYSGTYRGESCNVDLPWLNGKVSGTLLLESGKEMALSGEEPGDAVLRIRIAGSDRVHRLKLSTANGETSFVGDQLSFTEVSNSGSAGHSVKAPEPPDEDFGQKSYTGSWRGRDCTARITWTPTDDPDTLREGQGTLIVEGDMALSITALQLRENYIEFGIEPDETGENYKATREVRRGRTSWTGRFLTLTEAK